MDCEKFDQHVMDALYDELDELTHAALKRHVESCARCASTLASLRATREAAVLPLEQPPDGLEDRILAAVEVAQRKTPWQRKALRGLAWAGSHAMRPQLAMAALFVLVIGSSLLLLRARPGTTGTVPLRVTERGIPTPDQPDEPAAPAATALPPAAAAPMVAQAETKRAEELRTADSKTYDTGRAAADERQNNAGDKQEADSEGAAGGAAAALAKAQATRASSGCAAALPLYDDVGTSYPGTAAAHTAMLEAARCYKSSGDPNRARELFLALKAVDGYRAEAESELSAAETATQNAAPAAKAAAPGAGAGAGAGRGSYAAPAPARAAAPPSEDRAQKRLAPPAPVQADPSPDQKRAAPPDPASNGY
ncbi:anti-sigma factor family protein [Chondromyces apiculatus]|uniref:Putative zinc-finger domain-containing protein n=1 Tax=Chondromyces apiculatus DSM 436 TaxID=1192034 RepID=A0A017TJ65_9BACT|nr:zf-HC2 domain-containing protein [Chondromyces apiculatus]EYF08932.1 Hypothetical protein CAP_0016 [Chondromyces apiculatus DSM 436]